MNDDEIAETLEELAIELGDLKVASNGGDREAREKMQAIYDLLDDAIEARSMEPIDFMLTGKLLTDAGLSVPDSLRQVLLEALQGAQPDNHDAAAGSIVSLLLELADQTDQNPFDVYAQLNSMLAAFPPQASALILFELIAAKNAVIAQAVAGFVLHSEAVLAQAAAEALAVHAKQTPVESSLIERLVRMRPWLPSARQAQLDAAIRALRSNALPPVKHEMQKLIKCYVSVCDGSGARTLFATQRLGARYQFVCAMMKTSGVDDAKALPDLPKSEMDDIIRQLKSSMPVMETDLAGIARMLELAIAENAASGTLPPFALIEVVERLGLGPIHSNNATPIELITSLLADLPSEQTNKAAVARANVDILDSELGHQWFEAGERWRAALPYQRFQTTRRKTHDGLAAGSAALLGAAMRDFGSGDAKRREGACLALETIGSGRTRNSFGRPTESDFSDETSGGNLGAGLRAARLNARRDVRLSHRRPATPAYPSSRRRTA